MKKNTAQFLASAIVAGLLAGSATLSADHHEKKGGAKTAKKDAKKMEAGKSGCGGKDECKGAAHDEHKDAPKTDEKKAE